jgi:hypothetical protein
VGVQGGGLMEVMDKITRTVLSYIAAKGPRE